MKGGEEGAEGGVGRGEEGVVVGVVREGEEATRRRFISAPSLTSSAPSFFFLFLFRFLFLPPPPDSSSFSLSEGFSTTLMSSLVGVSSIPFEEEEEEEEEGVEVSSSSSSFLLGKRACSNLACLALLFFSFFEIPFFPFAFLLPIFFFVLLLLVFFWWEFFFSFSLQLGKRKEKTKEGEAQKKKETISLLTDWTFGVFLQ